MRSIAVTVALCLMWLLPAAPAQAAPVNDAFASAEPVSGEATIDTDSTGSTVEPDEPSASCGAIDATLWYRIEVAEETNVRVDTFGSKFDTAIALWRGTDLSELTEVTCNDDAKDVGSLQSRVETRLSGADTLYLQVGGFDGAAGRIQLNVTVDALDPRLFEDAIVVNELPFEDRRTMRSGDEQRYLPCGRYSDTFLWYRYTPSEAGIVTIEAQGSGFTELAVFRGTDPDDLARVTWDCQQDVDALVDFDAEGGHTYMVILSTPYSDGSAARIRFESPGVPANDHFATAQVIAGSPFRDVVYTHVATVEDGEPRRCGADASVWFSFTAEEDERYVVDTLDSNFDTVLAVYEGTTMDELEQVACQDDAGFDQQSIVGFDAVAGRTYHVQAGGFLAETGRLELSFEEGTWREASVTLLGRAGAGTDGSTFRACLTSRFIRWDCLAHEVP